MTKDGEDGNGYHKEKLKKQVIQSSLPAVDIAVDVVSDLDSLSDPVPLNA